MHEILLVPSQRQCWNPLEAYKSQHDAKKRSLAYGSLTAQLNPLPSITGAGKCQKEGAIQGRAAAMAAAQEHGGYRNTRSQSICCAVQVAEGTQIPTSVVHRNAKIEQQTDVSAAL